MPADTNLFTGVYKGLPPPPHKAHSYIQTQHRETGKVGVVRERGRTADDRVIKAELHLPDRARRRATIRPSRLLLMTWASKNWMLLSRPSLRCVAPATLSTKYHIILAAAVFCVDVRRHVVPYTAAGGHMETYVALRSQARVQNASTYGAVRSECERGLRTTNDGRTSTQMTVLEIVNGWLPRIMQCNDCFMREPTKNMRFFLVYMYYTHLGYQTSIFGKKLCVLYSNFYDKPLWAETTLYVLTARFRRRVSAFFASKLFTMLKTCCMTASCRRSSLPYTTRSFLVTHALQPSTKVHTHCNGPVA